MLNSLKRAIQLKAELDGLRPLDPEDGVRIMQNLDWIGIITPIKSKAIP